MTELPDFIRARLDEEQDQAERAAAFSEPPTGEWRYDDGVETARKDAVRRWGENTDMQIAVHERVRGPNTTIDFGGQWPAVTNEFQFIAHNSPARALRRITAMRWLVDFYEGDYLPDGGLELFAAIWSDHPDYGTWEQE